MFRLAHAALGGVLAGLMAATPARAATLVFSNDVMSELEPCGCRNNPEGGVVRKATLLAQLKQDDASLLQLDAGNLLFESEELSDALKRQSEAQAGYLVRALNELGQDAVTPGAKDFALGLKVFEKLRKQAKFKFLSANLAKKGGALLLAPHAVFERKTKDGKALRIGVFGLSGPNVRWPSTLTAKDAQAAAKAQVAALRGKKVDLVIALTHQGLDADKELAERVPGIDVIVGGQSQSYLQKPEKAGGTLILQTAFRNQHVGVLPLGPPLDVDNHRLVTLGAEFDPEKGNALTPLVEEFQAKIAEINTEESRKLEQAAHAPTPAGVPKYQTFPKCAECHAQQTEFWRKTNHANALKPLLKAKQIRNKDCLRCHSLALGEKEGFADVLKLAERNAGEGRAEWVEPEPLATWLETLHEADDLEETAKLLPSDAKPAALHVALSNFKRVWAPVQCENCHAPGYDHPFGAPYAKAVDTSKTCLQCHTQERAPGWYEKSGSIIAGTLDKKKALIACPPDKTE
ncbi:MAG: hypothetical protein IT285_09060 [Bdellovibrionales bacterium]|nr:hypothetical protein [Bdellovibrionales bacterium]